MSEHSVVPESICHATRLVLHCTPTFNFFQTTLPAYSRRKKVNFCSTKQQPISNMIRRRRWLLFGHFLRQPESVPAHKAMNAALSKHWKRRSGARKTGMWSTLLKEYKAHTKKDISQFRTWDENKILAKNRSFWFKFVDELCHALGTVT